MYARLSRLSLAQSTANDVENILDEQPANIPALDIVVDDMELRGKRLGRVEIEAINRGAQAVAREGGAREWRLNKLNVILPEAVFKATGNASPVSVPAKGRWMGQDIAQWAQRYRVPFAFNPHFPINTLTLMRGAVGLQMRQPELLSAYLNAVFSALWAAQRNLGDAAELSATLAAAGVDGQHFSALVADPDVKARLIATTEEAVERGVFGAPTCFVGNRMFFGQDRLDFVREALG